MRAVYAPTAARVKVEGSWATPGRMRQAAKMAAAPARSSPTRGPVPQPQWLPPLPLFFARATGVPLSLAPLRPPRRAITPAPIIRHALALSLARCSMLVRCSEARAPARLPGILGAACRGRGRGTEVQLDSLDE
jgi:hypothetical protein